MDINTPHLDIVKDYYSNSFSKFGATNKGVDWSTVESQFTRFEQLVKVIPEKSPAFSIVDYGCGFGSFYEFLSTNHQSFDYLGVDLVEEMIHYSQEKFRSHENCRFSCQNDLQNSYDYLVASGIFNVIPTIPHESWKKHFFETLDYFNEKTELGFSFNCLTTYSDPEKMTDKLFYADPCEVFDYCKKHFSRNVALLHDYQLYEFTIIVRKSETSS